MSMAVKSIRFKVSLFVLVLIAATTVAFYIITVQMMNRHILSEVIKRAESLSRNIAATAGYSFLSSDLLGLDNLVFRVKDANRDVEYIAIVNNDRKAIVHSDISKSGESVKAAEGRIFKRSVEGTAVREVTGSSGNFFEVESPVVFMNKTLGSVVLGINKSALMDAQREARKKVLLVFVGILFSGIVGSLALSSFITRPIEDLSSGIDEFKGGKVIGPIRVYSHDELGRLTENFNEMTALITQQRERLGKYARDLEESYFSTIKVLAAAIDARDPYTHGHSARVSMMSLYLGREIGLGKKELEELEVACLFHDIGKIKTPDSILRKGGRLDSAEQREMMRHPEYGADILRNAPSLHRYIPPVRHHHEWFNGGGYPDGLRGDMIPFSAAIISIVDAFDAMTSDRPYRKALSPPQALAELINLSGIQFEPKLVEAFIEIIEKHLYTASSSQG